ncbi:hypothetical protein F4801DRAFT_575749 [Xylaria longipes]|nr:hypothetical protein F4801DRAFT_575749 [Xylaria longipes]
MSENVCSDTLHDYFNPPPGLAKLIACYFHTDCIIENLSETPKANMASASVLLGLMPTLLAGLAPSIAEVTLLSLDRPLLSLLVSLAVPSLYPTRTLQYDDPYNTTTHSSVAVTSIVNIGLAVAEVSGSTILSWGCLNWYMPIIWVLLPVLIHLVSAVPFQVAFSDQKQQERPLASITWLPKTIERPKPESQAQRKSQRGGDSGKPRAPGDDQRPPWFVVFASCTTSIGAFIHLALGIYIFSSLLFVPANDALSLISRLILSAFACRMVIILEIAHMSSIRRPSEP